MLHWQKKYFVTFVIFAFRCLRTAVLDDPLVRTKSSCQDIWHSYGMMQPVFKQASLIESSTAILIMQGSKDRVLNSKAIIKLVSNLNANDLTVKWFKGRGHLILETADPKVDVLQTIDEWLKFHTSCQKKC